MIIELGHKDGNSWILGYQTNKIKVTEYVELGYKDGSAWELGYIYYVDPAPAKPRKSVELGYKQGNVWHLGGEFVFRRLGFNLKHMRHFLGAGAEGNDFNDLAVSYYTQSGAKSRQFNAGQQEVKDIIGFEGYSPVDDRNNR